MYGRFLSSFLFSFYKTDINEILQFTNYKLIIDFLIELK